MAGRRFRYLMPAALSALIPVSPVFAIPLKPSGKWMVEGQDNMCALSRPFGSGSDQVTLGFRPSPLSDRLDIFLFTRGYGDVQSGKATLQFDGSDTPFSGDYISYSLANKNERQITFPVSRAAIEALPTAAQVSITIGKKPPILLDVSDARKATGVLSYCQDELRKQLGVNVTREAEISIAAAAKGSEQRWFTPDDYPKTALSGGAQGVTRLLLTIDVEGRISECVPYGSTGNAEIDRVSCATFKQRGRYTPAKDGDGHSVTSHKETAIHWQIPGR